MQPKIQAAKRIDPRTAPRVHKIDVDMDAVRVPPCATVDFHVCHLHSRTLIACVHLRMASGMTGTRTWILAWTTTLVRPWQVSVEWLVCACTRPLPQANSCVCGDGVIVTNRLCTRGVVPLHVLVQRLTTLPP